MAIQAVVKVTLYADKLHKRLSAKRRRVLYKQGAYLRTTMQRSMRYSDKPSAPGKPPHAHKKRSTGPLLRKLIKFAVNEREGSVICGPEIFSGSKVHSTMPLPQLLDKGGRITTKSFGREVAAQIAPRPFTAPVFSDGGAKFRQLIEREQL